MIFKRLHLLCSELEQEFQLIPAIRKEVLLQLSGYISNTIHKDEQCNLNFICTHNSRRSHIGQLMFAIASDFYEISNIHTFSGGTETTAFNERVVTAIKSVGFQVDSSTLSESNPKYFIKWKKEMQAYEAFSKKYNNTANFSINFAAIMLCSEADEGCPLIHGSDFKISLPYQDPKAFDDTNKERESYSNKVREIGREALFTMLSVKNG